MVNSRQFMFVVQLVTKIREIILFPFRHKRKNVSDMSETTSTGSIVMTERVGRTSNTDHSFK